MNSSKLWKLFFWKQLIFILLIAAFVVSVFAEFAGGTGTEADPWQIATVGHLNNVRNYLGTAQGDKYFVQIADIDLYDATREGGIYWNDGAGWEPIGNANDSFQGNYNGSGEIVRGLFINRQSGNQGLFGYTENAVIGNLGVTGVEVTGATSVGALAGMIVNTNIFKCYSTGIVYGIAYTGGLVGRSSQNSEIAYSNSLVSVNMYIPPKMVFVEGGTFNPDENYTVTLSSYYLAEFEVTQSEWTAVMGAIYNPYWGDRGQGPNYPAYRITWYDAIEYCNRLSAKEGLTPAYSYGSVGTDPNNWPAGWNSTWENHVNVTCDWDVNGYRLSTEMEWEFAARGGVPAQDGGTFNTTYAGSDNIDEVAWHSGNSNNSTHPAGAKLPNELGLYDMSGNVIEWNWDKRGLYPTGTYNNPTGPATGDYRCLRGGSWHPDASQCNVDGRFLGIATLRYTTIGFRVARSLN